MPVNFPEPADRRSSLSTRQVSTGRTGLILGAIVVVLMVAAFAYFWRGAGAADAPDFVPADSIATAPDR